MKPEFKPGMLVEVYDACRIPVAWGIYLRPCGPCGNRGGPCGPRNPNAQMHEVYWIEHPSPCYKHHKGVTALSLVRMQKR